MLGSTTPYPINYWKGRPNGLDLVECAGIVLDRAGWPLDVNYGMVAFGHDEPDFFYLDGASGWETLTDLADGFAARLFFLRDGTLYVMDREDVYGTDTGLAYPTRGLTAFGLERVSPFESLRNYAEVRVRPHSVLPFNVPILDAYYLAAWTNAGPVAVPPSSTVDILIKYPNTVGSPNQGNFVRTNQNALAEPYRHEVWSRADKTGTDMGATTGNGHGTYSLLTEVIGANDHGLTYVMAGNNQKFCTVRLQNWDAVETAYFFKLQVQVIGVFETGESVIRVKSDAPSLALNGKRVLEISSRWIQDSAMADHIGQAYVDALAERENASPASVVYQWSGDLLYAGLLAYDLGAHVKFGAAGAAGALANFGLNDRWLIVGQELDWMSADGQDALVKLTYEKAGTLGLSVALISSINKAQGNTVTMTWAFTVAAGVGRLLVVNVCKRAYANAVVGSITYGGVALTYYGMAQTNVGNYPRSELWYLVAPAVGTANIVVTTIGAGDWMSAGASNFVNVDQTTPLGPLATSSGNGSPASAVVVAGDLDLVLDGIATENAVSPTEGAGQTLRWAATADGNWKGAGSTEPGAASVTMSWTTPACNWALVAVAVKSLG